MNKWCIWNLVFKYVEALGGDMFILWLWIDPSSCVKTPMGLWLLEQRFLLAICSITLQTHTGCFSHIVCLLSFALAILFLTWRSLLMSSHFPSQHTYPLPANFSESLKALILRKDFPSPWSLTLELTVFYCWFLSWTHLSLTGLRVPQG